MTDIERLKTTQQQLGEQWDVATEKWNRLRKAHLLETRVEEKLRLEPQIIEAEKEREGIEAQLAQVERDLQQATAAPPASVAPATDATCDTQALDAYLHRVFQTTLELDLGGIDPKVAGKERDACLNLPEVYTALLTMSTAAHEASLAEKRELPERERLRSAVDMVNAEKHLVLLGDPGSGKSMFVNFVALCMAGELLHEACANCERLIQPLPNEQGELEKQAQPWDWQGLLPVKFVLRDVAAKALPKHADEPGNVTHLLEYLKQMLHDGDLPQALPAIKAHLDAHGGIVLFDGLDEVPEADKRRLQILQAVEDFAIRFEKCRILVTCRTYAYQKQQWRLKNFPVAVLSPFTDGQIRWFVNGWYRHVAQKRDTHRENWQGRAELLKQAISRSPQLHSFARRPLLLTLMASLHAWRGGSLPEKRAELYEDAADMLLETWVEKKVVRAADGSHLLLPSLEEVLKVSKTMLRPALHRLAFEAHQRQPAGEKGTADIAESDLIAGLLDLCRAQHVNPLDLAEHLSNRVGLLASHGNQVYTFPHRSFQEYLAACYLAADGNYPYNIARLVSESPDHWREIALLTAAKTSEYSVMLDGFVNALCPSPVPETPNAATGDAAQAVILAAQAVAEAQKLSELAARKPEQVRWLRDWLKAILTEIQPDPPLPALERARAGDLLAAFGDDRPGVGCIPLQGGARGGLPDIAWVHVPAGEFWMGSDKRIDPNAYNSEQPRHRARVPEFWMSRYPITNAQYRAFVEDDGYTTKKYWTDKGWTWREERGLTSPELAGREFDLDNHPVVNISWYEAMAFCAWLTAKTSANPGHQCPGSKLKQAEARSQNASASFSFKPGALAPGVGGEFLIRLPTEAEWEYAARGPQNGIFPWGDADMTPEHANYDATNLGVTSAVGCFPNGRTWCGADDMIGNVWEWCLNAVYDYKQGEPSEQEVRVTLDEEKAKVARGGTWINLPLNCRCAYRNGNGPDLRDVYLGFRVVVAAAWTL